MTNPNPLTEREQADLVALLDGELTGELARALEAKLSIDPAARAEAEALKRTWDLLDFLPKAEPTPSFTHRTLEKLTPIGPAPPPAAPRRLKPWFVGAGWAAALLAAVAAGFAGVGWTGAWTASAPANPDQDLARDLRLIENKRLYDHVDDLEFLNSLDQSDLFDDDQSGS